MQSAVELSERLMSLETGIQSIADELAVFLVFDRPARASERPGLAALYFAQRCLSDEQLDDLASAFREIGAYVEMFEGEQPFLRAVSTGHMSGLHRAHQVVYNGIGWGVGRNGFTMGRKAVLPLVADSYELLCANADAYSCAFTLHKFHCFTVLRSLGVAVPPTWQFRLEPRGWVAGRQPPEGMKVIVKSAFEAWSVGVGDDSVFAVDAHASTRVGDIADHIGQDVVVQQFVAGAEVYVPVLSTRDRIALPPVQVILDRAPADPTAVMTIDDVLRPETVTYRIADTGTARAAAQAALDIVEVLGLDGLSRIDFRVDDEGLPWVFDIAVSPGLGRSSAAFASVGSLGLSHEEFVRMPVAAALAARGLLLPQRHHSTSGRRKPRMS